MLCKLLLENGANPNLKDSGGSTALHSAVFYRKPKICALLLEYGADVNAKNENGTTPLDRAVDNKDRETIKILKAAKAKRES